MRCTQIKRCSKAMKVKALTEHLNIEITVYKELVGVLQKETENLVARDYKGLYETSSRKGHIVLRINHLSEVRQGLMNEAARSFGAESAGNLSEIIELASFMDAEALRTAQSAILSIVEGVKEINKLNALVVEGSLDNINKTLGLLSNFIPRNIYKPTGAFESIAEKGARLNEGV